MRFHKSSAVLDGLGALAILVGLWGTFRVSLQPILVYEEGIVLTDASLVLSGWVPHQDFYTGQAPGIFYALALLWKVFGVSVLVERGLGVMLHLALGLLAGRLAGRALGRSFSTLACGLVLMWLIRTGAVASGWIAGMTSALLFCELALRALEKPSAWRSACAGVALGAVACLSLGLFAYFAAALSALTAWTFRRRDQRPALQSRRVVAFALGVALPVLILWAPLLARAGLALPFQDLILDQVRHVDPARALPIPRHLLKLRALEVAVLTSMIVPGLALIMLVRRRISATLALVGALSWAALPHLLARPELGRALSTMTPVLILLVVSIERLAVRGTTVFHGPLWALLLLLYCVLPITHHLHSDLMVPESEALDERYSGLPERDVNWAHARHAVLTWLGEHTSPGQPIYVGLKDHRLTFGNEMDLYFLADRPGATRYMQFDPNMTNRSEQQQAMIADFEQHGLQVAVLSEPIAAAEEPNASSTPGAVLLDEYFLRRFQTVGEKGRYRLMVRRQPE